MGEKKAVSVRSIVSSVVEVAGVGLIGFALWTWSIPVAIGFVGVACLAASWVLDGGRR
jgi:hypothetical protein